VVFYLLWQWLQVYARTLVSGTDGEEMARGLYGPWVVDAYWYMLASIVALALARTAAVATPGDGPSRLAGARRCVRADAIGDVDQRRLHVRELRRSGISRHAGVQYAIAANGVEVSLPKLAGATVMTFIVYALPIKFVFPIALRWLDTRAAAARPRKCVATRPRTIRCSSSVQQALATCAVFSMLRVISLATSGLMQMGSTWPLSSTSEPTM
jgi:hypothetical protein